MWNAKKNTNKNKINKRKKERIMNIKEMFAVTSELKYVLIMLLAPVVQCFEVYGLE